MNDAELSYLQLANPISTKAGEHLIRKVSSLIQFHFKTDPDKLTDYEFSEYWRRLQYALWFEDKRMTADGGKTFDL